MYFRQTIIICTERKNLTGAIKIQDQFSGRRGSVRAAHHHVDDVIHPRAQFAAFRHGIDHQPALCHRNGIISHLGMVSLIHQAGFQIKTRLPAFQV